MMRRYTVPALNAELNELMQSRYPLIQVEGEIGQIQQPASGHVYLVLRDRGGPRGQDSSVGGVIWRADWTRLRHQPKAGERVLCTARVGVYSARGTVQLQITEVSPAGIGDLAREIEARKARLLADGLLDPGRKRQLPPFPRIIGVATSRTGAALQDFLKVSRNRYPACRILVSHCLVQGPETPASVIRAVEMLLEDGRCELVVVTRGGGSKEDLLQFQDEGLARFLATSRVPVVSAVGHQIDTTLCDLVADAVAPTPSAAALLTLPDGPALVRRTDEATIALEKAVRRGILRARERVEARAARLRHPGERLKDIRRRIEDFDARLGKGVERRILERKRRVEGLERSLNALSPLAVLERGFAIVRSGTGIIRDPSEAHPGERLDVRVRGGSFEVEVVAPGGSTGAQLVLPGFSPKANG